MANTGGKFSFELVDASVVDLHGVTPSPLSSCHCKLKFLFDANVFVAAYSHFAAIISVMYKNYGTDCC